LSAAFASGKFNKVPVIDGSNSHEYSLLSAYTIGTVLGREINAAEYPTYIAGTFGAPAAAVLGQYPVTLGPTPTWAYDQALTDSVFSCNGRSVAKSLANNGAKVFAYEFNDVNAPMVFVLPQRAEGFGAYHASELQYVFPGNPSVQGALFNADQQALSAQMVKYWAQFARSGDPNAGSSPARPAYTVANDTYLSLTPAAIAPTSGFAAAHQCLFWTGS
jgi:para-nitrobenzyl esterase